MTLKKPGMQGSLAIIKDLLYILYVCTNMVSRLHHVICEHMHAYRGCLFHPHFVVVHIIIIFNFVRKISAPLALKRLLPAISALNVCIHLPKYISM